MIRVAIIDDHPIVRAGMRAVLELASDITVVAEGGTGAAALAAVDTSAPDLLVLDVNLPDAHGAEIAAKVHSRPNAPRILILTMHADDSTIFSLLDAGVQGYILKEDAVESLAHAVRAVAAGRTWLSPEIAHRVVRRALAHDDAQSIDDGPRAATDPPKPRPRHSDLTPRELEVLELLAQGLNNGTIADRLCITKRTVQNHVSNVYAKLQVTTRAEALLYALRHGIVAAPSGTTIG